MRKFRRGILGKVAASSSETAATDVSGGTVSKDDFMLASFPKSGNTWVRFLIANVYNILEKKVDEVDFHNVHDIIPELSSSPARSVLFDAMPHVLKTHEQYTDSFHNVILVLRNPWGSLYSYLKYLNSEMRVDISLADMVGHPNYGIGAIVDHTNSYVRNVENLLIITYEDLHVSPVKQVRKVLEFLYLSGITDDAIEKAVERSSFRSMRDIEVRKGRKFGRPDFVFTRSGQVDEGQREISKNGAVSEFISNEMRRSPILYLLYG